MDGDNPTPNRTHSTSERGHAKFLESIDALIAVDATLDAHKLNAPPDLTSEALATLRDGANARHTKVGNSKADWRTVTRDRQDDADLLDSMAARMVALLESRGASAETVEDGRSYVRKIRGDQAAGGADESERTISNSQQSNAAKISMFIELIDFCEAQPEYAGVTNEGFTIAELRAFAESLSDKHTVSIGSAATLSSDRDKRNAFFYDDDDKASVLNVAKRYKKLVFGAYGGESEEYARVNAIPFQKA